jgi:hypothetical protein
MARAEVVLVPEGRSGRSMTGTLYVKNANGSVDTFSGHANQSIGWTREYGSHQLAGRKLFTPWTFDENGNKVPSKQQQEGYRVDGSSILIHGPKPDGTMVKGLGCFIVHDWDGFKNFTGRGSPKFTVSRTPPAWAGRGNDYDGNDRSYGQERHAIRDDNEGRYRPTRHDRDGNGIDDRIERRDRNRDGRDDRTGRRLHSAGVRYDGDDDEIRAPSRQGGRQRVSSREESGGGIDAWNRGDNNPFSRG